MFIEVMHFAKTLKIVGKSSLINLLLPNKKQETNEISEALGRGKHITRVTEFMAYQNGWIDKEKLLVSADRYGKSPYGMHLKAVADGKVRG